MPQGHAIKLNKGQNYKKNFLLHIGQPMHMPRACANCDWPVCCQPCSRFVRQKIARVLLRTILYEGELNCVREVRECTGLIRFRVIHPGQPKTDTWIGSCIVKPIHVSGHVAVCHISQNRYMCVTMYRFAMYRRSCIGPPKHVSFCHVSDNRYMCVTVYRFAM